LATLLRLSSSSTTLLLSPPPSFLPSFWTLISLCFSFCHSLSLPLSACTLCLLPALSLCLSLCLSISLVSTFRPACSLLNVFMLVLVCLLVCVPVYVFCVSLSSSREQRKPLSSMSRPPPSFSTPSATIGGGKTNGAYPDRMPLLHSYFPSTAWSWPLALTLALALLFWPLSGSAWPWSWSSWPFLHSPVKM
jgi:hypothetical protein